jgi:hypothetical protein
MYNTQSGITIGDALIDKQNVLKYKTLIIMNKLRRSVSGGATARPVWARARARLLSFL